MELEAYKGLLDYEVGLFEAEDVEPGKGEKLKSIMTEKTYYSHDINASFALEKGQTVWARVAPVGGMYHIVSSMFFVLPIKIMPGMRDVMRGWGANSFTAKEIAGWVNTPSADKTGDRFAKKFGIVDRESRKDGYGHARDNFSKALSGCGMEGFFSVETFEKWVRQEKRYGHTFTIHAVQSLIPDDVPKDSVNKLIDAVMIFENNIPRRELKGKTPEEAFKAAPPESHEFDMDMFSIEIYADAFENACKLMRKDLGKAYRDFEALIQKLLDDRIPLFHSFRIFGNAAVCLINMAIDGKDDYGLGREILEAAIRMNPRYDFALGLRDKCVSHYEDYSRAPKKDRKMIKTTNDLILDYGRRKYLRTVFRKYEDFLRKEGIDLSYKTRSQVTTLKPSPNGTMTGHAIGRNDPCYCGSGKKYKKCHGASNA
jgi:hypothetical protein